MLAAIGTVAVAGCVGSADEGSDDNGSTGPSNSEPEAHSDEPEILEGVEYELGFGEWFEDHEYGIRVDGIETTTRFTKSVGESVEKEMPDGKQLVFVDFVAKQLSPDQSYGPSMHSFAAAYDQTVYEPVESVNVESCWGSDCGNTTDIDWLQRADKKARLGYTAELEHGETREFWYSAVLDEDVSRDEIAALYSTADGWAAWTTS